MAKRPHHARRSRDNLNKTVADDRLGEVRIIGGRFRGRRLRYAPFESAGDTVTRPMKHRVREAIFNLIGTEIKGRHAIDLFAGTGALGLEALSRGAVGATLIERHIPTGRIIEENIATLGVEANCQLLTTSAFLWVKRDLIKQKFESGKPETGLDNPMTFAFDFPLSALSCLVFCSPPYAFYVDRQDDMLELIASVIEHIPVGSVIVVEADERFDFRLLPGGTVGDKRDAGWQVRTYAPAVVGVWRG